MKHPRQISHPPVLTAALLTLLLVGGCVKQQEKNAGEAVVALVNGEPITLGQVDIRLSEEENLEEDAALFTTLRKEVLDHLIDKRLLLQEAEKQGIEISSQEISDHIRSLTDFYAPQEFEDLLKDKGLDRKRWESEMREDLLVSKLVASFTAGLSEVSEEEIKAYYQENLQTFKTAEQVKIRQIMVGSEEEAKKIRLSLLRGAPFDQLAAKTSASPDRLQGGEVGYFSRGQMPEAFDIAFDVSVGDISPVVSSPYGYHIFLVEDKRREKIPPLDEVQDSIRRVLTQERQDRLTAQWIKKLREQAEIHVNTALLRENEPTY